MSGYFFDSLAAVAETVLTTTEKKNDSDSSEFGAGFRFFQLDGRTLLGNDNTRWKSSTRILCCGRSNDKTQFFFSFNISNN